MLAQTIDKEIIIINDGSTDNSLTIILDYAKRHPFITVIHICNQGLSAARNKGILLARGEYLFFVDADDYLLGNKLKEIYQLAHQHQIDIIKLQTELFKDRNSDETYLWPSVSQTLKGKIGKVYSGHHFLYT